MRRAAAVAVVAWVACGCSSPPPPTCVPQPVSTEPNVVDTFAFLGEPWSVTHVIDVDHACKGTSALFVGAEGFDSQNDPLALDLRPPTPADGGNLWRSTLGFTPSRLGAHHLSVTIDPGYGTRQYDVYVPRDARALTPFSINNQWPACDHAHLTPRGGLVCSDEYGLSYFFRDGKLEQEFPAPARIFAASQVIWVLDADGGLTRRSDPGSGPLIIEPGALGAIAPGILIGNDEEVVIAQQGALLRVAAADGGLVLLGQTAILDAGRPELLAWAPDAGVALLAEARRWARIDFSSPDVRPGWIAGEFIAGVEGTSGLWFIDEQTDSLVLHHADPSLASIAVRRGPMRSPWLIGYAGVDGRMLLTEKDHPERNRALLLTVRGDEVDVTLYQAPLGATFTGADSRGVHARAGLNHFFYDPR